MQALRSYRPLYESSKPSHHMSGSSLALIAALAGFLEGKVRSGHVSALLQSDLAVSVANDPGFRDGVRRALAGQEEVSQTGAEQLRALGLRVAVAGSGRAAPTPAGGSGGADDALLFRSEIPFSLPNTGIQDLAERLVLNTPLRHAIWEGGADGDDASGFFQRFAHNLPAQRGALIRSLMTLSGNLVYNDLTYHVAPTDTGLEQVRET